VYGGMRVFRRAYPKGLVAYDDTLRVVVGLYNWIQIATNVAVLAIAALNPAIISYAWYNLDKVDPIIQNEHHQLLIFLGLSWYLLKVLDLLDTVFFILRGKYSHVTFLQVYHHASMVLMVWTTLHYVPLNQNLFYAATNSFVHVVLYTYYLLTSMGTTVPWKRMVTNIQLLQFVGLSVFTVYLLVAVHTDPAAILYTQFTGFQMIMFLGLFINFYVRNYILRRNRQMTRFEANRHMD
jgi:elongation of very long chain fatty acids protein 4